MVNNKRVSMADIALQLGVSKSLVSFVLNKRGDEMGVNKETQKKIINLARKLEYRPNQLARGLRLKKTNTIGLVLPNISDSFYARIASRIETCVEQYDYNVLYCNSRENAEKELRQINLFRDRGVDGLIIAPTQKDKSWVSSLIKENLPFVLIDRHFPKINTNHVIVANFNGAYQAVNHLLNLDYKKIGQLTISPYLHAIKERDRGYREALKERGYRINNKMTKKISIDDVAESVKRAVKELVKPPLSVQAIFTHNNVLAEFTLQTVKELRLRVPQDLALVSFGDHNLFKVCISPVTCIREPIEEIGEQAVEILMNEINNKDKITEKKHIIIPTKLIVRESCGALLQ